MAGIYIHVPFCATRCIYCGFFSTTELRSRRRYTEAVLHELQLRDGYLPAGSHADTLYVGGGTPSQLDTADLRMLLEAVRMRYGHPRETTVECNPDDVTPTLAHSLAEMGVDRVSMGIQTFNDRRLKWLGRRHSARQAREAVATLRGAGITNLSIDLMFGFPGQEVTDWQNDIDEALRLDVAHVSAYSLMVEEGTPLARMIEVGSTGEPDEETTLAMYDLMCDRLTGAGYEHYEISNFARPGRRSLHNSSYWNGTPYIGLGAGAHSYDGSSRQWNVTDLGRYLTAIAHDEIPSQREVLDTPMLVNDRITTALRTCEGLDLGAISHEIGADYARQVLKNAQPHLARHLLRHVGNRLILTRRGIHLSDTVMSDLMIV